MSDIKVEYMLNSFKALLSDPHVCNDKIVLLKLKFNLIQSMKHNKNTISTYADLISKIDKLLLEIKYIEMSTEKKYSDPVYETKTLPKSDLSVSKVTKPNDNKMNSILINSAEIENSVSTSSASRLQLLLKSQKVSYSFKFAIIIFACFHHHINICY